MTVNCGGVILCGGESRRMGRPKADLPFGDEPLVVRVVRRLADSVAPVVVVAAAHQRLPELPEGTLVARDREPGQGPLPALLLGLESLPAAVDAALVTACDVPFLEPAVIERLIAVLGDADAAAAHVEGRCHPLPAVYRTRLVPLAARLIESGERRLGRLLEQASTVALDEAQLRSLDPQLTSFQNLNHPQDYAAALERAAASAEPDRG